MPTTPMTFGEPRSGRYDIFRGYDHVDEVSYDMADTSGTTTFDEGEWFALDTSGKAVKPSATASANKLVYPNVTGKERSDVKASDSLTGILGSKYHARTSKYLQQNDTGGAVTLAPGDDLCVRLVGGLGVLVKAVTAGLPVVARVLKAEAAFTDDSDAFTGLGSPENVIEIEVL